MGYMCYKNVNKSLWKLADLLNDNTIIQASKNTVLILNYRMKQNTRESGRIEKNGIIFKLDTNSRFQHLGAIHTKIDLSWIDLRSISVRIWAFTFRSLWT